MASETEQVKVLVGEIRDAEETIAAWENGDSDGTSFPSLEADIARLDKEMSALRAALEEKATARNHYVGELNEAQASVARLRAELVDLNAKLEELVGA